MVINSTELFLRGNLSDFSSDSDQDTKVFPPFVDHSLTGAERAERDAIIGDINTRLANGWQVNLAAYPRKLFVVHYRGIHFFKTFIGQAERREKRRQIKAGHFREGIYSPAVYDLARLRLGEPINTPEKKLAVKNAIADLNRAFELLATTRPTQPRWYGNTGMATAHLFEHYQRYVNSYEEFRSEALQRVQRCYTLVPTAASPYISTADDPKHAVHYALGAKADASKNVLRPGYDEELRAKHPKVGYVQTLLHSLQSLRRHPPLALSTLQASREVEIKDRLLNERETTFLTAISAEHVVNNTVVRFPSMNVDYQMALHDPKYGFGSKGGYTQRKKSLKNRAKSMTLVEHLAEHYTKQLSNMAHKTAREMNGFIVYLALDGRLRANLPTVADIKAAKDSKLSSSLYPIFRQNLQSYTNPDDDSDSFDELDADVQQLEGKFAAVQIKELKTVLSEYDRQNILAKAKTAEGLNEIKALFEKNELSVNAVEENCGDSLMHWAYHYKLTGLIELLIQYGVNICMPVDQKNHSLLHLAAIEGNVEYMRRFISMAPNLVNCQNNHGCTPLHYAAYHKQEECVRLLCQQARVDFFIKDNAGKTAYDYARDQNAPNIAQIIASSYRADEGYESDVDVYTNTR